MMDEFIGATRLGAPLLVATWAAIICRRVGVFNLTLDAGMTAGAFVYLCAAMLFGVVHQSFHPAVFVLALASVILAGTIIGAFYGWLITRRKLDEIITGIAVNIAALGVIGSIGKWKDLDREPARIPAFVTADIGNIQAIEWLTISVFAFSLLLAWVYARTVPGRRLSSVGTSVEAAQQVALPFGEYRFRSTIAAGAVSAVAGALLIMLGGGQFSYRIAGAYGFTALAFGVIGSGRFILASALALAYGAVQVPEIQEYLRLTRVPDQLSLATQYLLPLAILVAIDVWRRWKRSRVLHAAPA